MVFQQSCVDERVGPQRKPSAEAWMLLMHSLFSTVLEKTLDSPLHVKEIKLVNPKGNQS